MATISAQWQLLSSEEVLRRSSQALSVIGNQAYVFGGELKPREPRDNDVHIIDLLDATSLKSVASSNTKPSPRVGVPSTTLESKIYLYSGRGGVDMAPIEESGCVWCFDPENEAWNLVKPTDTSAPFPEARSYHCSTSDGISKIFIHAGCPSSGRLSDLWSFDTNDCTWTRLTSAPGRPRGGTSIAYSDDKIYRMGGFDGTRELGGVIDIYDLKTDTWKSVEFPADGSQGPGNRSVSALVALRVRGRSCLLTMFGESDPSSLGHQGAGKMLQDVWMWDVEDQAWAQVMAEDALPQPRGWFAADVADYEGENVAIVQGGLGESNERLDDVWMLKF